MALIRRSSQVDFARHQSNIDSRSAIKPARHSSRMVALVAFRRKSYPRFACAVSTWSIFTKMSIASCETSQFPWQTSFTSQRKFSEQSKLPRQLTKVPLSFANSGRSISSIKTCGTFGLPVSAALSASSFLSTLLFVVLNLLNNSSKLSISHLLTKLQQYPYVRFWPNPAVRSSIAGCQVENPAPAATGRYRPEADDPVCLKVRS